MDTRVVTNERHDSESSARREARESRHSTFANGFPGTFPPVLLAENLRQQHRRPRAEAMTHDGQGVPGLALFAATRSFLHVFTSHGAR